jgi:anti-anti-sigma factor
MTNSQSPTQLPTTPLVEVVVTDGLSGPASQRLQTLLAEAMALRPVHLVVDLAGCEALDAVAVDVLLDTHRRMWNNGGRLTLRSPSPRLERILRLARVDHVFHVTHGRPPQRPPDRRTRAPIGREATERP